MAFDVNNFIIDRPIRGTMVSTSTGDILWNINQIKDPALKCTSTSEDVVDAIGNTIMTFDRAKKAEFSCTNTILDLSLAAAQFGTSKNIASALNKITSPKFEEFTLTSDGQASVTLAQIPVGVSGSEIKQIYAVNANTSLGTKYTVAATASATEFTLSAATKVLTLPTGLTKDTKVLVRYDYLTDSGVSVENTAINFPTAGKFILVVLGHDACDIETEYVAYVVMPAAKLKSEVDLTFTSTGNHPLTIECMQNYCDSAKKLFSIIVPQA